MNRRLWSFQARFAPYLFVAPFLILFTLFMLYPLGRSIVMSLYSYSGAHSRRYVGLGHYQFFLTDKLLWLAVANTLFYALACVTLLIPISLALAILLNHPRLKFRNLLRFAFFAPYLVGNVFVSVIFALLLSPRHGLIPRALSHLNPALFETNWLGDPIRARIAIIIATLWLSVGWAMVFFLAALQGIDPQLYDAASVDGAGHWSRFRHVTLPGIRPILIFIIITTTIAAFQMFELPYVIFLQQGSPAGPGFAGLTIVMYLYQQGFDLGDIGAACAIGWFLVILILAISLIQIRITRATREDH
jgi:ABC-type sugar transport system permease subunit